MESGKDVGRFSRHHGQIVPDLVAIGAVDKGHADHTFGIVGMEFLESAKGQRFVAQIEPFVQEIFQYFAHGIIFVFQPYVVRMFDCGFAGDNGHGVAFDGQDHVQEFVLQHGTRLAHQLAVVIDAHRFKLEVETIGRAISLGIEQLEVLFFELDFVAAHGHSRRQFGGQRRFPRLCRRHRIHRIGVRAQRHHIEHAVEVGAAHGKVGGQLDRLARNGVADLRTQADEINVLVRYCARWEDLDRFFAGQILVGGLAAQTELLRGHIHHILGVVGDVDFQGVLVDQRVRVVDVDRDATEPMLDDFIVESGGIGLDAALVDGLGFGADDTDGNIGQKGAAHGIGETDIDGMQGKGEDGAAFPLVHGRSDLGQGLCLLGL